MRPPGILNSDGWQGDLEGVLYWGDFSNPAKEELSLEPGLGIHPKKVSGFRKSKR